MMKKARNKFRKGAASFYVVAFSTLILIIIATSFAAIIISEATRTMNDDLAQSAYDSALAGIEDAKIAFYNYQSCKEQGVSAVRPNGVSPLSCAEIVWYMENPDCDMVAHILGRIGELESGEASGGVLIQETTKGDNMMQQAYTCVKINTKLSDYRSSLSEENPTRAVRVKLANTVANNIKKVKISWYSSADGSDLAFTNTNASATKVQFPTLRSAKAATPPTIAVGLVQTTNTFNLSDFDKVKNGATNRGTVFLVPTDSSTMASKSLADNYIGTYVNGENVLTSAQVSKSNDRSVKNLPYVVYCPRDLTSEFACSLTMDLPDAIGGARSDETFMLVMSIPYGQPNTDFAMEFFCGNNSSCGAMTIDGSPVASGQAVLEGVQVNIDSTGRANSFYRRVEARLDSADTYFPYPLYAVELLDNTLGKNLLEKNMTVTTEYSKNEYPANLNSLLAE